MAKSAQSRFAFVLPSLSGGGAERVAITLARQLTRTEHNIDFVLLNEKGGLATEIPENSRIFDFGLSRLRKAISPISRYLVNEKPAAILAFMWPVTAIVALARRRAGAVGRLVLTEHTMLSAHYADKGIAHHLVMRATTALAYRVADARVAVSTAIADDMAFLSGVPRKNIEIIHNPVELRDVSTSELAVADRLWGVPRGKRVLTVGSMKPAKNHALLIRAFARLADENARLMIVGGGPLREHTHQIVQSMGLSHRVIMPGFRDPNPYYASADLFVLSSDREGFPLVVVEALGHGLPIVCTNYPGGPSEIFDEGLGKLVPCNDEEALAHAMLDMLGCLGNPRLARARAQAYAPEVVAQKYLRVLLDQGLH